MISFLHNGEVLMTSSTYTIEEKPNQHTRVHCLHCAVLATRFPTLQDKELEAVITRRDGTPLFRGRGTMMSGSTSFGVGGARLESAEFLLAEEATVPAEPSGLLSISEISEIDAEVLAGVFGPAEPAEPKGLLWKAFAVVVAANLMSKQ